MLLAYSAVVDCEFLLKCCEYFGQLQVWYISRPRLIMLFKSSIMLLSQYFKIFPIMPQLCSIVPSNASLCFINCCYLSLKITLRL